MANRRNVALSIGVSDAKPLPYLAAAANGARSFHAWATALGYEATLLLDEEEQLTIARLREAFDRALSLSDSKSHGLTFCQANFRAMTGCDVAAAAQHFARRIVFVHFRDIEGTAEDFTETFHDNGPTDMPAMLRLYHAIGFNGPIRVDHVPSLAGEEHLPHGYAALGRLFAVGYMKGILDTAHIPYR